MKKQDLTGRIFSRLTVISLDPTSKLGTPKWICRCECGNEKSVQAGNLRSGGTISCGCYNKEGEVLDLAGKRFGKLIVSSFSHWHVQPSRKKKQVWNIVCDCGNKKTVLANNLFNKQKPTVSCGCHKIEIHKIRHAAHRTLETTTKNFYVYFKGHAKYGGKNFSLSYEDFKNLIFKNCSYCNSEPSYKYCKTKIGVPILYNGLDRVDSSQGYELDNVVTCCAICNRMKLEMNKDKFIDHVGSLYSCFKGKL